MVAVVSIHVLKWKTDLEVDQVVLKMTGHYPTVWFQLRDKRADSRLRCLLLSIKDHTSHHTRVYEYGETEKQNRHDLQQSRQMPVTQHPRKRNKDRRINRDITFDRSAIKLDRKQ